MENGKALLIVEDLEKTYGKGENRTKALQGISFEVAEGEFLGIMGASGSGKTTLLNCIATMIRPSAGRVLLEGRDVAAFKGKELADYRGREIGYLFQDYQLLENLTARENILLPLSLHGVSASEAEPRVAEMAERLEISEVLDKFPSQMSGGQRQRVAAVRALISDPEIVIADEPTGALDSANAGALMDKLLSVNRALGKTIVMVTHDANAASFCSRILFIRDGRLFHELRRDTEKEAPAEFYGRIVEVLATLRTAPAKEEADDVL